MPCLLFNPGFEPPRGPYQRFSQARCVVLVNGFPGVGKFTIAKTVSERLGRYGLPHRVIHSYDLIDSAEGVEPFLKSSHNVMRKCIRRTALEGLKKIDDPNVLIIFTTTLSSSERPTPYDDMSQLKEYVKLAEARRVPLVVINLLCDLEENAKRLCDEKRKCESNTKLVDVGTLEKIRSETRQFGREEVLACRNDLTTIYLDMDVSEMDLEEEVEAVWEVLGDVKW